MVNLSYVKCTLGWGSPSEHAPYTTASMVGLGIDSSIHVEGLLPGCKNYKPTYCMKYWYNYT
jgi:hypothetical protein